MDNNIPRWITNLALDIYKLIQKYDALAYFQGKVKKCVLAQQGEIDRHEEWENKRNQHFEKRLDEEPRLQDKNTSPPEDDWRWETSVIHRFESDGQGGLRRTFKTVSGWVPPELSFSTEPKITRLLPLSREHILTLEEKYTLLAAIYDSGRRGTDQIPPWKWPDLSMELSSDELSDAKKSISFEGLCKQILIIPQDNEGWLRALLDDVEKDVTNISKKGGEISEKREERPKGKRELAETKQGNKETKRGREGMLKPKPPEFLQNLLWILRYGKKWWWLLLLAVFVLLLLYILPKLNLEYQNIYTETKTSGDSSPAISTLGPNSPVTVNYTPPKSKAKQIAENEVGPSPEEIFKDIESRPPLQREDAMRYYIGLKVKWRLRLKFVSMLDEETAEVIMEAQETYARLIFCVVEIFRYPKLKVAKQDSVIWVSGEIIKVDMLNIYLMDVSLEFE